MHLNQKGFFFFWYVTLFLCKRVRLYSHHIILSGGISFPLFFYFSKHGLVASGKNTLYLAGGEFPDGSASRSVWRYDPVLDIWQEMAPMLVSRSELG